MTLSCHERSWKLCEEKEQHSLFLVYDFYRSALFQLHWVRWWKKGTLLKIDITHQPNQQKRNVIKEYWWKETTMTRQKNCFRSSEANCSSHFCHKNKFVEPILNWSPGYAASPQESVEVNKTFRRNRSFFVSVGCRHHESVTILAPLQCDTSSPQSQGISIPIPPHPSSLSRESLNDDSLSKLWNIALVSISFVNADWTRDVWGRKFRSFWR